MTMGEKIKAKRLEKNMKPEDLAAAAGLKANTIKSYERDKGKPSQASQKKIAAALGCTVEDLQSDPIEEAAPVAAAPDLEPQIEMELEAPAVEPPVEPEIEAPAAEPEVEAPAAEPEVEAPAAEPEIEAPAAEPEVEAPAAEPEVEAPAAEPEVEAPAAEPEVEAPAAEPEVEAPAADSLQLKISYDGSEVDMLALAEPIKRIGALLGWDIQAGLEICYAPAERELRVTCGDKGCTFKA